ncbi:hypothetical protein EV183_000594 [Coemansia sp. RSA 2336]|nr:hypothetical protein EV183_000594 [Coemansia sp. RSA 2336]
MDRLRGDFGGYEGGDMHNMGLREDNTNEDAINGPVVFSCSRCRTILGDTFSYVASFPERNLFALQAVPDSISCGKARKMSTERGEEGSVFYELTCAECDTVVGRRYVTTVEEMDAIRNTYSLDIDKVMTYELGKCMKTPSSSEGPPPEFYTSIAFHEDMVMVKSNITAIAAKLQKVEQAISRLPATSPRSAASSKKRYSQGLNPDMLDSSKRFGR